MTDDALARFNTAPMVAALEAVHGCLPAPAFAMVLTAGRPYPSVEALVARAEQLARALPWRDVQRALESGPPTGDGAPAPLGDVSAAERAELTAQLAAATARRVRELVT